MSRVQSEYNTQTGLFGSPPRYYDQNLALFGVGFMQRQFWFDSTGTLKLSWNQTDRPHGSSVKQKPHAAGAQSLGHIRTLCEEFVTADASGLRQDNTKMRGLAKLDGQVA